MWDMWVKLFSKGKSKSQQIHKEEKPLKCNTCESRFLLKSTLKIHQIIHNGEKQFKCVICESRITQKSYIKVHLRKHNGEKKHLSVIHVSQDFPGSQF